MDSVIEDTILTKNQEKGRAKISKRVREGSAVITFTDKDSRVVICPPGLYIEAAEKHLCKDQKVDFSELKPTENKLNRVASNLISIFGVGTGGSDSQAERVKAAGVVRDVAAPTVSFLWKTHKNY